MRQLRPYQLEALERCKEKLESGVNRQVIKLPTGLGKTPFLASLPDALNFKRRMMVLVHREELATQAADKLRTWNPTRTVGIEMGSSSAGNAQLVVASVPTIGRKGSPRLTQFNLADFDAIVVDECHRSTADSYRTVFNHFNVFEDRKRLLLGVTATPNRADGRGLGEIYEEIVYERDLIWGIREGWLSDLKGIKISTHTRLDDVHTKAGDFDLGELSLCVNTYAMNDLTIRSWLEHGKDRQTIVFAVDVKHAQDLAEAFKRYGVAAEAIWGDDPHRHTKVKALRTGGLRVLVNCQILIEGFDCWQVGCIVMDRPTESPLLFTQAVGRGTRIPDGVNNLIEARQQGLKIEKEDCILIDMVHATSRHSLVTLPSLFGLNKNADLRGKKITDVMDEVEQIKKASPLVDVTKVTDIKDLKSYAQQVDLFKVKFPEEITKLSPYQWHDTGKNSYVLLLTGNESVTVLPDLLGVWHIVGTINGNKVRDKRKSMAAAITEADFKVDLLGGRRLTLLVKRAVKWHDEEPTKAQLGLCKLMKIDVPPGATKGEVHLKLGQRLVENKRKRELKEVQI